VTTTTGRCSFGKPIKIIGKSSKKSLKESTTSVCSSAAIAAPGNLLKFIICYIKSSTRSRMLLPSFTPIPGDSSILFFTTGGSSLKDQITVGLLNPGHIELLSARKGSYGIYLITPVRARFYVVPRSSLRPQSTRGTMGMPTSHILPILSIFPCRIDQKWRASNIQYPRERGTLFLRRKCWT
jgi:hypothetical protein